MRKPTPEAVALSELYAQAVELFVPIRDWSINARVAGIMERRELYHAKGLPIRLGGSSQDRKAGERFLDTLEGSGTVIFIRAGGKRTHQRLSDLALWQLTSLVGTYGIGPMLTAMLAIRTHQDVPHEPANYVPETWLMGCDYDAPQVGRRIVALQQVLAVALVRGWVESWSDNEGGVAYVLTDTGRQLLDNSDSLPNDEDLPPYDEAAGELFMAAIRTARDELKNAVPSTPGHVVIPLSCGLWPEDETAAHIPAVFSARGQVRTVGVMRRAIESTKRKMQNA